MWHALLYHSIITCFIGVASADIAQNEISFQDYKVVSTTIWPNHVFASKQRSPQPVALMNVGDRRH